MYVITSLGEHVKVSKVNFFENSNEYEMNYGIQMIQADLLSDSRQPCGKSVSCTEEKPWSSGRWFCPDHESLASSLPQGSPGTFLHDQKEKWVDGWWRPFQKITLPKLSGYKSSYGCFFWILQKLNCVEFRLLSWPSFFLPLIITVSLSAMYFCLHSFFHVAFDCVCFHMFVSAALNCSLASFSSLRTFSVFSHFSSFFRVSGSTQAQSSLWLANTLHNATSV